MLSIREVIITSLKLFNKYITTIALMKTKAASCFNVLLTLMTLLLLTFVKDNEVIVFSFSFCNVLEVAPVLAPKSDSFMHVLKQPSHLLFLHLKYFLLRSFQIIVTLNVC